jgi:hypothetical protein
VNNVDESGFPLNNSPPQIISEKRIREVVSLTNMNRGENRSMLLSSRIVHSPTAIFNRVRKCREFKDGLSPGSGVEMSDLGYVNEVLFFIASALQEIQNTGYNFTHFG